MKQQTVIERALPIVAAAYARKFGISIGIGGDEAYTNGNHVQLPEIPHNSPYQKAIWGFLAHEAGHLRDTNFDLVFTSEYIHGLWNALEDGRTEEAFIRDFPGAKETLDEALNYFISIGKMDFVDVNEHPASILSTYILYWVRAEWRKQDMLKEHFASAQKALDEVFPEGVSIRLQALLRKAPATTNSQDVLDLTLEIMSMLKEESEKNPPKPNGAGGDSNQKSDKSNPDDSSGDQGNSESDQKGGATGGDEKGAKPGSDTSKGKGQPEDENDKSNAGKDDSGSSKSQGQNKPSEPASGENKPEDAGDRSAGAHSGSSNGKGGRNKNQAIKEALQGGKEHVPVDIFNELKKEFEKAAKDNPNKGLVGNLPSEVESVRMEAESAEVLGQEVMSASVALRKQLLSLVQAKDRVDEWMSTRGRKIDTRRIARTAAGNMRVFRQRTEKTKVNTAVHLLVDASGSMGIQPMKVANEAALALALALDALPRVSTSVSYFSGDDTDPVVKVIEYGQPVQRNLNRFSGFGDGGTPMASGLWHAAKGFAQRKEERRIVIVVTDGSPNRPEKVRYVTDLMKRSGIEVLGIGINSNAVSQYFDENCVIKSVNDLKGALFAMMREKLAG